MLASTVEDQGDCRGCCISGRIYAVGEEALSRSLYKSIMKINNLKQEPSG
jgi:hypothetical protein